VNAIMEPLTPGPTGSKVGLVVAGGVALVLLAGFGAMVVSLLGMRRSLRQIEGRLK
jgi:hypothetical protein